MVGRSVFNLRFADDIVSLVLSIEKLAEPIKRLDEICFAIDIEINDEKTGVMTNSSVKD